MNTAEFDAQVSQLSKKIQEIKDELGKVIIGQRNLIDKVILALVANGHVLVEGVPGTAKTLLIKTLAEITNCSFSRIQFTPDLLPTDITGINVLAGAFGSIAGKKEKSAKKGFDVLKGPIFANFILADEINRASPKVQSALLEAMEEMQVTIGKETFHLNPPFFVFATQNPLETSGAYNLPVAQIDRFMFKLYVDYLSVEDEKKVLELNVMLRKFEDIKLNKVLSSEDLIKLPELAKQIYMKDSVKKYIISLIDATRHPNKYGIESGQYIDWGGSPRSAIGLFIASKAHALIEGKSFVSPDDIKSVAHDILRHKLILNYEGQAKEISTDDVITEILAKVPAP